jgi:hypothetical protein
MKSHPLILLAAVLACHSPTAAQNGIPRALEFQPKARETNTVHDGIVFHRGQTYLIRNSRAARVDATLVPRGQILTVEGRLVTLPSDFVNVSPPATVRGGLCTVRGQAYLIRNGRMLRVNAALVPEGQVLTAEGQLVPLPADFSGFELDRAPDGTVLLAPLVQAGPQAPSHQASVPQAPKVIRQSTKPRFIPISLELPSVTAAPVADLPRVAAATIAEEIRSPLPLPANLLPPAPPSMRTP